jgi:hypothetical protein
MYPGESRGPCFGGTRRRLRLRQWRCVRVCSDGAVDPGFRRDDDGRNLPTSSRLEQFPIRSSRQSRISHCERSEAIPGRRASSGRDCFVAPLLAMTRGHSIGNCSSAVFDPIEQRGFCEVAPTRARRPARWRDLIETRLNKTAGHRAGYGDFREVLAKTGAT